MPLVAHTLVIVESPTKAKTIRGFLPKGFKVEASMGHVRDLPNNASEIPASAKGQKWANLGVNTEADFEPLYVVPKDKKKVVRELKDALKGADQLLLATDEDREGESISWHLLQLLAPKVPVKRMVFHEITKDAIGKALDQTRDLDMELVHAQETRRILDRLVGYTLSPLLWKRWLGDSPRDGCSPLRFGFWCNGSVPVGLFAVAVIGTSRPSSSSPVVPLKPSSPTWLASALPPATILMKPPVG